MVNLSQNGRCLKLRLWRKKPDKLNFLIENKILLPCKKIKISIFFFQIKIANVMEQQIGPTEKGREVITIGDRCKSVGVLSAEHVSIQT